TLDGAPARVPQISAAQKMLARKLGPVELEIKLEAAVVEVAAELFREGTIVGNPDAVRVQKQVIDPWIFPGPGQKLEKLRMQCRLAARELENFDTTLPIDDALDAP